MPRQKMKNLASIACLLAVAACVGKSPAQQYFELKQHYAAVTYAMAAYRQDCDKLSKIDPCRNVVGKMQALDKLTALSFSKADEALIPTSTTNAASDPSYRDIVLANAKVALSNLESFVLKYKNQ